MSDVQLVVREAGRDWAGRIHGSDADLAIAALSADPVTLTELGTVRPDLVWKCEALTYEVKNLLKEPPPTSNGESSAPDIPF